MRRSKEKFSRILWDSIEAGAVTGGENTRPWVCSGICVNEDLIRPGDLFVSSEGEKLDTAMQKGASAAIVSHVGSDFICEIPLLKVHSTFEALRDLARAARFKTHAKVFAVQGRNARRVAFQALSCLGHTKQSGRILSLSMASLPENYDYGLFPLAPSVRPDIAVISNAQAGIQDTLFANMPEDGIVIVNKDCPSFDTIAVRAKAMGVQYIYSYGRHNAADAQLLKSYKTSQGTYLEMKIFGENIQTLLREDEKEAEISVAIMLAIRLCDQNIKHAGNVWSQAEDKNIKDRNIPTNTTTSAGTNASASTRQYKNNSKNKGIDNDKKEQKLNAQDQHLLFDPSIEMLSYEPAHFFDDTDFYQPSSPNSPSSPSALGSLSKSPASNSKIKNPSTQNTKSASLGFVSDSLSTISHFESHQNVQNVHNRQAVFRVLNIIDLGQGKQTVILDNIEFPDHKGAIRHGKEVSIPYQNKNLNFVYRYKSFVSVPDAGKALKQGAKYGALEQIVPDVLGPGDFIVFTGGTKSAVLTMSEVLRSKSKSKIQDVRTKELREKAFKKDGKASDDKTHRHTIMDTEKPETITKTKEKITNTNTNTSSKSNTTKIKDKNKERPNFTNAV